MANNLRVFNTLSEYNEAELVKPSVSYVVETDKVIYDYTPPTPPVFQGKWKAIYSNGNVTSAECGSSSEIVIGEIERDNLVSVEIGDCVTSIGSRAFWSYTSLLSITIPSGVTSIGQEAFRYCRSLTSIDIPSGVTSIGGFAFQNCSGLTKIVCNAMTPPTIKATTFLGSTCPIYVPSQSVETYKTDANWSTYASRIQPIP